MSVPQPPSEELPAASSSFVELARQPTTAELTAIIPTVGRPLLRQTLESIIEGTRWPARLIIVDQSERDLVADLAEQLRHAGLVIEHVRAPRRGVAAGRNRGIERVATRWFVINDDDQLVAPDWLELMQRRLDADPDAVITGMVAPAAPRVPSSTTDDIPAIHTRPMLHRDPLFAGNMGTSLQVVARVGLFDECQAIDGAEDNDWGYRALRRGIPIIYAPEVRVTHLDWRDEASIDATYRHYALAQGAFYGKYLRRGDPFIACRAARDLLRGPWLLLRAWVSRNPDLQMLGRAELAGIMPGIINGLRMSRRRYSEVLH